MTASRRSSHSIGVFAHAAVRSSSAALSVASFCSASAFTLALTCGPCSSRPSLSSFAFKSDFARSATKADPDSVGFSSLCSRLLLTLALWHVLWERGARRRKLRLLRLLRLLLAAVEGRLLMLLRRLRLFFQHLHAAVLLGVLEARWLAVGVRSARARPSPSPSLSAAHLHHRPAAAAPSPAAEMV